MSLGVKVDVHVFAKDEGEWGESLPDIHVESWWNDESGRFATLVVDGHRHTVAVKDLRAALTAVTSR